MRKKESVDFLPFFPSFCVQQMNHWSCIAATKWLYLWIQSDEAMNQEHLNVLLYFIKTANKHQQSFSL